MSGWLHLPDEQPFENQYCEQIIEALHNKVPRQVNLGLDPFVNDVQVSFVNMVVGFWGNAADVKTGWTITGQGQVLYGANIDGEVGLTGGSATLSISHSHTSAAHSHSHSHTGPSHVHALGNHSHTGTTNNQSITTGLPSATKTINTGSVGTSVVPDDLHTHANTHNHGIQGENADSNSGGTGNTSTDATSTTPANTGTDATSVASLPPYFRTYWIRRTA